MLDGTRAREAARQLCVHERTALVFNAAEINWEFGEKRSVKPPRTSAHKDGYN